MDNIINKLNNTLDEGEYIVKFYEGDTIISDILGDKDELLEYLKYNTNRYEKFSIYKLDSSVYDNRI